MRRAWAKIIVFFFLFKLPIRFLRSTAHSLRHSCLTQFIKDGVDLRTVQKIAGHKNINTTAGYIKLMDVDILGTISPLSKIKL